MIHCPNCDTLIDEHRFDLDDEVSEEDRARFVGFLAGRAGDGRNVPAEYFPPASNISGRFSICNAIRHHWLIGFDAGASVRASIEAPA